MPAACLREGSLPAHGHGRARPRHPRLCILTREETPHGLACQAKSGARANPRIKSGDGHDEGMTPWQSAPASPEEQRGSALRRIAAATGGRYIASMLTQLANPSASCACPARRCRSWPPPPRCSSPSGCLGPGSGAGRLAAGRNGPHHVPACPGGLARLGYFAAGASCSGRSSGGIRSPTWQRPPPVGPASRAVPRHRGDVGQADVGRLVGLGRAADLGPGAVLDVSAASSPWGARSTIRAGCRSGAILTLIGVVNLPIIKFSVDWWNTLHQPASVLRPGGRAIHPSMLYPLLVMAAAFTLIAVTLHLAGMRTEILRRRVRTLSLLKPRRSTGRRPDHGPRRHAFFILAAYAPTGATRRPPARRARPSRPGEGARRARGARRAPALGRHAGSAGRGRVVRMSPPLPGDAGAVLAMPRPRLGCCSLSALIFSALSLLFLFRLYSATLPASPRPSSAGRSRVSPSSRSPASLPTGGRSLASPRPTSRPVRSRSSTSWRPGAARPAGAPAAHGPRQGPVDPRRRHQRKDSRPRTRSGSAPSAIRMPPSASTRRPRRHRLGGIRGARTSSSGRTGRSATSRSGR